MSETLNAGHSGNLMKSVTDPVDTRSIRFPIAPPISSPVGSHSPGRVGRSRKYTTSAPKAARVRIRTNAPPPAKKPKATPLFWTWTRLMPGRNLCTSPMRMPLTTARLVIRSMTNTAAMTPIARANAARRAARALTTTESPDTGALTCSALDDTDQERAHEVQDDDRHHRREVDRPQRRDEPAEQPQVGLGAVAQEVHGGVAQPSGRHPHTEREQQVEQDVDEDEDDVDLEQRAHVAGDVRPGGGECDHQFVTLQTRSIAAWKAARTPERSSASRPRAVDPPGEVTSRRTVSVS